jgi:protoporphyrinogen oxidase
MDKRRVIVIGAGPAGLTAAWELVMAGHEVTVLERDPVHVGGLARTISYKEFRFDIGGHRFFTRNPEISRWWRERLPGDFIRIKRLSRIYYRGRFFHYPLRASDALLGLGWGTSAACLASYLRRAVFPIRPELSFADWVKNRFGDELFAIFFKTYTEKVWGMPCSEISADWASQRIKGLSPGKVALAALSLNPSHQSSAKTLVDEFEYPRLGAGMLWERTRDEVVQKGARVLMGRTVTRIERNGSRIVSVITESDSDTTKTWAADEFVASMPLGECLLSMNPALASQAQEAAKCLRYRDFIMVALIVDRADLFPDHWIYVHAPEVRVGRIENFNNWGPDMVPAPDVTCLGMEYFCTLGDALWEMSDREIAALAAREIERLGLAKAAEVIDDCVVRVEKAYPVYDPDYQKNVTIIRQALDAIENLHMAGRNGMHKYNNQDHSMLTGMLAARNVGGGRYDVWRVNTDAEYQEDALDSGKAGGPTPRPKGPG